MNVPVPAIPGHSSESELLALIANPTTRISQQNLSVGALTPVTITPLVNRKTIIIAIQSAGALWIKFNGTPAVVGQGLYLSGGMFGLDISSTLDVSLIAASGSVSVCILQLGMD